MRDRLAAERAASIASEKITTIPSTGDITTTTTTAANTLAISGTLPPQLTQATHIRAGIVDKPESPHTPRVYMRSFSESAQKKFQ